MLPRSRKVKPLMAHTELKALSQVNHEPDGQTISTVVKILNAIMRPMTERDWRYQDKVPQTGAVIFVVNHISNADPPAIGQFLAFSGRWPRFLAKGSLFEIPVVGRIIAACGQIPVQRESAQSKDALIAAARALEQGRALVIYPEGTITRDPDLWPMRGKTGAARLAFTIGCPVVPIGQWGAQELMPGRKPSFPRLLPRKTLRVAAGDPISLDDLREKPLTVEILDEATERIMDAITVLVAELRGATPPAHRYDPDKEKSPGDQA
jgi:1-acyl-sn-glycerol-3-phosphate acyltransferase